MKMLSIVACCLIAATFGRATDHGAPSNKVALIELGGTDWVTLQFEILFYTGCQIIPEKLNLRRMEDGSVAFKDGNRRVKLGHSEATDWLSSMDAAFGRAQTVKQLLAEAPNLGTMPVEEILKLPMTVDELLMRARIARSQGTSGIVVSVTTTKADGTRSSNSLDLLMGPWIIGAREVYHHQAMLREMVQACALPKK